MANLKIEKKIMKNAQQSKYIPVISHIIRSRRIELGLTQQDVAQKMGVTYEGIGAAERGIAPAKTDTILRYCSALQLDPRKVFDQIIREYENSCGAQSIPAPVTEVAAPDEVNPKISDFLSEAELLAQLAEEASELAQAALKLRRALDGTSPTPKSVRECRKALVEEIADVQVCVQALPLTGEERIEICRVESRKRRRWLDRLTGRADK